MAVSGFNLKVLAAFGRFSLRQGGSAGGNTTSLRWLHGRTIALTPQKEEKKEVSVQEEAQAKEEQEAEQNRPLRFSSSAASHRTWSVEQSLGSRFQQPLWKVAPISLLGALFLLWCVLRPETEVDQRLGKELYEHLPGLLADPAPQPLAPPPSPAPEESS